MKPKNNKAIVGRRKYLVKNLLLIDGISRAGKFLLADLLNGLDGIEPIQYYRTLENIPFLERFGLINRRAAQELLHSEIDTHCYKMLIGRNFNIRSLDKTYIYDHPRAKKYLVRCSRKDEQITLNEFHKNNIYSSFIAHEAMPNIKLYLDTFPKIKIISVQRSPLDIVYSWHQKNLEIVQKENPISAIIFFKAGKKLIPWYVWPQKKEYISLKNSVDRTILIMESLFEMNQAAYSKLSLKDKQKIVFIRHEDILVDPKTVISKMSKFLKRKILPEMNKILKKEKLPNSDYAKGKDKKMEEIKKAAFKKYFERLLVLEEKYYKSK